MSNDDRWLLPDGIEEVLPDEARRLEQFRRQVLDLFASWGYELVMPPMIEYLDALLTGVGKEMDLQTFKLTDQMSGRMMGIRADMTPQAARIDAHYLKREVPVRLCYLGPVLRTRPDEFAGSREPLQLGAELFGHSGAESDAEILRLMLATLSLVGIKDLHIDLGHVGVFRGLARAADLSVDQEDELFNAMQRKAGPDVAGLLDAWGVTKAVTDMLHALVTLNGDDALQVARKAFKSAPADVTQSLDELDAVREQLSRYIPELPVYFDLSELSGYGYYTGVVFSAFVPGHGRAVAKGGRYDGIGQDFGRARTATGFGSDLRELLALADSSTPVVKGILAPAANDEALRELINKLRSNNERVIVNLPGAETTAAALGCDREIVNQNGSWTVITSKE